MSFNLKVENEPKRFKVLTATGSTATMSEENTKICMAGIWDTVPIAPKIIRPYKLNPLCQKLKYIL